MAKFEIKRPGMYREEVSEMDFWEHVRKVVAETYDGQTVLTFDKCFEFGHHVTRVEES